MVVAAASGKGGTVKTVVEFKAGKARETVTETRDRLSEELGL